MCCAAVPVVDSRLLSADHHALLCRWVGDGGLAWRLLYRDGDRATGDPLCSAPQFHKACDGEGPRTIVVARVSDAAEKKTLVGGFTSIAWQAHGGHKPDHRAFIFTSRGTADGALIKFPVRDDHKHIAVYHSILGPWWGYGDLTLLRAFR